MNPDDNSLEKGYDSSVYSSSLEGRPNPSVGQLPQIPSGNKWLNIPMLKLNRVAMMVTLSALLLILIAAGAVFAYDKYHHRNDALNTQVSTGSYKVGGSLSVDQANPAQLLNLGQVNELQVNGQLKVNNVILSPTNTAPSSPVTGQIYYNQSANQPYYYNGTQFVSLTPQGVTSVGGANGAIGLGSGLTVSNGTLAVSNSLYQLVNQSIVNSLQGQKGNLTFSSGPGISINGTVISNTGVVSITSSNNSINVVNDGSGGYDISLA